MDSPKKLNLKSNSPISVQRINCGDENRYQGYLIGNIHRDLLVIGGIDIDGIAFGDKLIVRMVLESEVVGFTTTVKEIARAPAKLYFVSYPENVETANLRKSTRLNVFFPTDVQAKNPGEGVSDIHLIRAMMLNISDGGCFFSSKSAVQTDYQVKMSFSLPGETHVHSLSGKVIYNQPNNSVHAIRVRFANLVDNTNGISAISNWIDQHQSFALV